MTNATLNFQKPVIQLTALSFLLEL